MKEFRGSLTFFCGTGGTGKTSVLNALAEKSEQIKPIISPLREFYKNKGVKSEMDFVTWTPRARLDFQLELVDHCSAYWIESLKDKEGVFISERSPMCVASYTFYHGGGILELADYQKIMYKTGYTFEYLQQEGWQINVVVFPYPTPRLLENPPLDGFRSVQLGKDYVVQALMEKGCIEWQECNYFMLSKLSKEGSIADWAKDVGKLIATRALSTGLDA